MVALSILIQTLRLTLSVADASPIPGLKLIVGTALIIAENAEVSFTTMIYPSACTHLHAVAPGGQAKQGDMLGPC